jgi:hypothetical protein
MASSKPVAMVRMRRSCDRSSTRLAREFQIDAPDALALICSPHALSMGSSAALGNG